MNIYEQTLLDIANGMNRFIADIGSDDGSCLNNGDKSSWGLTFAEAVDYCEEELPRYVKRFGEYGEVTAAVCNDDGEPIVVYDGKKWTVWKW